MKSLERTTVVIIDQPQKKWIPTVYWCHPDPEFNLAKSTKGSVGYDLFQYDMGEFNKPRRVTVEHKDTVLVDTGLRLYLRYVSNGAEIRGRSSLSSLGILVYHGTIDTDYTGNLLVIMQKLTEPSWVLEPKSKIAQLVIPTRHQLKRFDCERFDALVREEIEQGSNERGNNGFGSTGV